jgi:hypothetical protein
MFGEKVLWLLVSSTNLLPLSVVLIDTAEELSDESRACWSHSDSYGRRGWKKFFDKFISFCEF